VSFALWSAMMFALLGVGAVLALVLELRAGTPASARA
jgi:hypothetical protein